MRFSALGGYDTSYSTIVFLASPLETLFLYDLIIAIISQYYHYYCNNNNNNLIILIITRKIIRYYSRYPSEFSLILLGFHPLVQATRLIDNENNNDIILLIIVVAIIIQYLLFLLLGGNK